MDFANGGSLARRRTELLPDGSYLFEDEMKIDGELTALVVTSAAWLLELYELRAGELWFVSRRQQIRPATKRFGVLYPPFSIAQPCFKHFRGHLIGIAATTSLPAEFMVGPSVFDVSSIKPPADVAEVIEILKAGDHRQRVDLNPEPSLLSLRAKRLIDENHLAYPSIARIAARIGVTHEHLSRQFKRDFGMSPSGYLRQVRVADATLRLARGEEIVNISQDVGYNDLSRFYKQFRKTTSTSPGVCKTILRPQQT